MVSILILFSVFISQIASIQFGFLFKDERNNLFDKKFIAFGLIPGSLSEKVKSEMFDSLNSDLREEMRRRDLEGVYRISFKNDPMTFLTLTEGKILLGLKGELSVFQNIIRFSCKRINPEHSTWRDAAFLTVPIMETSTSYEEVQIFTQEFDMILIEPAFREDIDSIYEQFIRWDSDSMVEDYDEEIEITFNQPKTEIINKKASCCCCALS